MSTPTSSSLINTTLPVTVWPGRMRTTVASMSSMVRAWFSVGSCWGFSSCFSSSWTSIAAGSWLISWSMCSMSFMRVTTSLNDQSGVDAPAAIPMCSVWIFAKCGGISPARSTMMVRGHMARHAWNNFLVLALFLPPTTTIASTWVARATASAWRFWVAEQMVQWTFRAGILCSRQSTIACHSPGGNVVCDTARASVMGGRASASAAERRMKHGPVHHPAVPCTSG